MVPRGSSSEYADAGDGQTAETYTHMKLCHVLHQIAIGHFIRKKRTKHKLLLLICQHIIRNATCFPQFLALSVDFDSIHKFGRANDKMPLHLAYIWVLAVDHLHPSNTLDVYFIETPCDDNMFMFDPSMRATHGWCVCVCVFVFHVVELLLHEITINAVGFSSACHGNANEVTWKFRGEKEMSWSQTKQKSEKKINEIIFEDT